MLYVIFVMLSGALWGTMGLFTRSLSSLGLTTSGTVLVRCSVASILFALTLLFKDRKLFAIRMKDLWVFLLSGIISIFSMAMCYYGAINRLSLSTAAILLYTAPSIVMILSALLFKESVTKAKALAVVSAFIGCALVSGVGGGGDITLLGLLLGLGSGVCYASYSIFSKIAMKKGYSPLTMNFYSTFFASIVSLFFFPHASVNATLSPVSVILMLGIGIVTCYLPYLLYTYGLSGLDAGKASVLASTEPVVASLFGAFAYSETLGIGNVLGMAFVLLSIVLLNKRGK